MGTPNQPAADIGPPALRSSGISFPVTVAYVSFLAAVAAAVATALSLEVWAMFIGWTCFGTGAGSIKRGAAAVACLLIGVLLGMGAALALGFLGPVLGAFALPVVIFLLATIAMISLLTPPLDSVPGYFLGMTTCFAAGLEPGAATFFHLGSATLIGAVAGWLLIAGPSLAQRKSASNTD